MGNVGSTPLEEHLSVRTNQTSTYSAGPGTTYVPGTTLPVHGWMQPCSSCSTTTARTVGKSHKFLCRRCDLDSINESSSRHRHAVVRAAMGQLAMEASEGAAAAAAKLEEGAATTTARTCHMDSVDSLCHAVVGEMLLADADDGYDPESPVTRLITSASGLALSSLAAKQGGGQGGSDSPVGVCDAAEVWSDLDPDSGGSSPRKGWRRGGSSGGATTTGLSVTLAGGGNGVSDMEVLLEDGGRQQQQHGQQQEEQQASLETPMSGTKRKQTEVLTASPAAWNHAPDALYPHDLWHWQH